MSAETQLKDWQILQSVIRQLKVYGDNPISMPIKSIKFTNGQKGMTLEIELK